MRLEAALVGGFYLLSRLGTASASGIDAIHVNRRPENLHERMRRDADKAIHQMEKRNDVFGAANGVWPTVVVPPGFTLAAGVEITPIPGSSNPFVSPALVTKTPSSGASSAAVATPVPQAQNAAVAANLNSTQWSAQAEEACMNAVMNLRGKASNPAGLAVCYNVPYLDQQKGIFEAELRMYNISAPSGTFVGVTPAMMMVTLQYRGATIQKSDGVLPVKRDTIVFEKRQLSMSGLTAPTDAAMPPSGAMPNGILMPSEVAIRKYVGQVNKDLMVSGMNLTAFQPLLVPSIAISAMDPKSNTNQFVNTSLSATESSFVAGIFSRAAGNITDPKTLLGQPADQLAAAAAGKPTPFVLPGVSLGVFPVGLIVTSIWMFLFVSTVGLGTIGRLQFRQQYRTAILAEKADGERRF